MFQYPGSMETSKFQLGNNAFGCAGDSELYGFDTVGMMQDGALMWETAELGPGERRCNLHFIFVQHIR